MAEEIQPGPEQESDPGQTVRRLVRRAGQAALASTLVRDGGGRPYVSLVLVAADHDGSPVLLLSDLADHTKNLTSDPSAALLFDGTAGYEDPLTGPRASLLGEIRAIEEARLAERLKRRFVARHPGAEVYADFKDFGVYRMTLERAHLVAGFGRIHWLRAGEVLFDAGACAALAEAETAIVGHMNRDHAEALALIAERLLGLSGSKAPAVDGWVMTGIDPEGFDLRAAARLARVEFDMPIQDAEAARAALVHLTQRARTFIPENPP
jgi:putative heme iron utilization protein